MCCRMKRIDGRIFKIGDTLEAVTEDGSTRSGIFAGNVRSETMNEKWGRYYPEQCVIENIESVGSRPSAANKNRFRNPAEPVDFPINGKKVAALFFKNGTWKEKEPSIRVLTYESEDPEHCKVNPRATLLVDDNEE